MSTNNTQTEKQMAIVAGAKAYMEVNAMSQSELAAYAEINPTYLNVMLSGGTHLNETLINIKIWNKLGTAVGVITNELWPVQETSQYKKIMAELISAKKHSFMKTIIAPTRAGKTHAAEAFKAKAPKHTILITINNLVTLDDVIRLLLSELKLPWSRSRAMRFIDIMKKLKDIKQSGGYPIIIFDEGENMRHDLMKTLKGLYDGVKRHASIVIIGTDQLEKKINKFRERDVEAGPQFYERFFPTIVRIEGEKRKDDFNLFFLEFGIEKGLQQLLWSLCDNYGALNYWLEPVLIECRENGVVISEEIFRTHWDMPRM